MFQCLQLFGKESLEPRTSLARLRNLGIYKHDKQAIEDFCSNLKSNSSLNLLINYIQIIKLINLRKYKYFSTSNLLESIFQLSGITRFAFVVN